MLTTDETRGLVRDKELVVYHRWLLWRKIYAIVGWNVM